MVRLYEHFHSEVDDLPVDFVEGYEHRCKCCQIDLESVCVVFAQICRLVVEFVAAVFGEILLVDVVCLHAVDH